MTIRNFHERNEWLGTHAERLTVTPQDGAIWTEDDTDTIWVYYAGAWHSVSGGGGGGGHLIADEGMPLPAEPILNFTGNSVVASDNPGTTSTDVTIDLIDHGHSAPGDGDTLDWDNVWSDAVHNHSSNAEGGTLDWDNVWSDGVHDHSSAAEGGTLDWDTVWSDAVHDHSSAAEGGIVDASVLSYTPAVVADWDGGVDPGDVNDALDQLAERTTDLEGSLTMVRQTIFTFVGNLILTGGLSLVRIYNKLGVGETISQVFLSVDTVPTGADIIVDIHKNGVTIFTNQAHRPVIAAGANTGTSVLIDVPAWADGDYLQAIIDNVGSTIVGANLTVHVLHS